MTDAISQMRSKGEYPRRVRSIYILITAKKHDNYCVVLVRAYYAVLCEHNEPYGDLIS